MGWSAAGSAGGHRGWTVAHRPRSPQRKRDTVWVRNSEEDVDQQMSCLIQTHTGCVLKQVSVLLPQTLTALHH